MLVVRFNLLSSLDVKEGEHAAGHTIDILSFDLFLVLDQLFNQPQVPADASYVGIHLQMTVHLEDSSRVWPYSHIQKKGVLGLQLLAETVEKPVVRVEIAGFLVLDAEEEVDVEERLIDFSWSIV